MSDPKVCPFCNSGNSTLVSYAGDRYSVFCLRCEGTGPTADNVEMAIQLWNNRDFVSPENIEENKDIHLSGYKLIT